MAEITITTGTTPRKLSAVAVFQGPQRLRIEALSPLGTPEMMISIFDGKARLYFPSRQEFFPDIKSLSPWIDLPLEVGELSALIFGALPPLKSRYCVMPPEKENDLVRREIVSSDGNRRISVWTTAGEMEIKKIKIISREQSEITVSYGELIKINGFSIPQQVNFETSSFSISFLFSDLELIPEDGQSLELPPPSSLLHLE
ncbi:MAG: hypothetical protein N2572_02980 [Syntrophales bacterium]|nr:hypothetical protein [Syntrophales bacterium]